VSKIGGGRERRGIGTSHYDVIIRHHQVHGSSYAPKYRSIFGRRSEETRSRIRVYRSWLSVCLLEETSERSGKEKEKSRAEERARGVSQRGN